MKLSRILPLVVSGASPALALSYTFSFTNVDGSVPGTYGSLLSFPGAVDASSGVQDIDNATLTYSSTAVPFDIPGGATIPAVGSLFALGLMRQAKKRLAAQTLVVNPVETVVS